MSSEFRRNLPHYAAQVDYEIFQLIDHIHRFGDDDPDVTRDDVLIRLDIVWSRLYGDSNRGPGASYYGLPGGAEVIESFKSVLPDIEGRLTEMNRADAVTATEVEEILRQHLSEMHKLSMAAIRLDAENNVAYFTGQLKNARYGIYFIVGILIFGSVAVLTVLIDRKEIQNLNLELEALMSKQTLELVSEKESRKSAEDDVAEREERLRQAAQLVKLGTWEWDCEAEKCTYCSEQHARAHGLTVDEYFDRTSTQERCLEMVHASDRQRVFEAYQDLRAGKIIELEYMVETPGGIRRLHEVARPVFDEKGKVVREIGSSLDVTDQRATEHQLFEAQKMEAIGHLTGGIAHDFNNLLAVIMGNLELLEEDVGKDGRAEQGDRRELIADALAAALRGRDLTSKMLNFARRAPLMPVPLDMNQIVGELDGLLRRVLPESIVIETSLEPGLWTVLADRTATESAILNLSLNARDAMPTGGKLIVETANIAVDQEYIDDRSESLDPGRYVMVAVTDTGTGIPPDKLGEIFEPFFTTKEVGQGSGLGLSMVQGFARQSGGTVHVYSELNVGTTFKLYLKTIPDRREAIESPEPGSEDGPTLPPGLRILLVEDEEMVRKVVSRLLLSEDAEVVEAQESASAERAFRRDGPFDVLLTDIIMPGDLQGPALAAHLRKIEPDLPVIYMSGYPNEAKVHGNGLSPTDIRLMKPITRRGLREAIRSAIKPR